MAQLKVISGGGGENGSGAPRFLREACRRRLLRARWRGRATGAQADAVAAVRPPAPPPPGAAVGEGPPRGATPRSCPDGSILAPGLALHHDGDPNAVRLVSADARGWVLELAEPGASYVSFAFSPGPGILPLAPDRILRGRAEIALSPLSGPAAGGSCARRGWMRLNASMPGEECARSALRDLGFESPAFGRVFSAAQLGIDAADPAPRALWLDLILAAPRRIRVALRGIELESRRPPGL